MSCTVLTLSFKSTKKMVVVEHAGELGYNDVVNSAIKEFNITDGPIVLYDANTDCEIPFNIFGTYAKQFLNSVGIWHVKIVPLELEGSGQNCNFLIDATEEISQEVIVDESLCSSSSSELNINQIVNKYCIKLKNKINSSSLLTPRERNELSSTVIKLRVNIKPDKLFNREDFIKIAKEIVDAFPKEACETYYIPSNGSVIAKGKLYNSYHNYRSQLNKSGVIRRRTKSTATSSTVSTTGSDITNLDHINTEIEEDIEFLKINETSSNGEVEQKWQTTHTFRQNILTSSIPTIDYIELFPSLKSPNIKNLMEIDLKLKYTDFEPNAIENWNNIYPKIIKRGIKINQESVVKNLCHRIEAAEEVEKKGLSFLLLPYIFPANGKRTYGSGRITKIEIQQSFISLYKTAVEAFETESIPQTPKILFVGNPVNVAYVLVAGERYLYSNPLEAVECCFYLYMGLNIKYRSISKSIWYFIQKGIFKINTEFDEIIASVSTIINDMQCNN